MPPTLPATFEELDIPFHAVTTDFYTHSQYVISEGPLIPAIAASAALAGRAEAGGNRRAGAGGRRFRQSAAVRCVQGRRRHHRRDRCLRRSAAQQQGLALAHGRDCRLTTDRAGCHHPREAENQRAGHPHSSACRAVPRARLLQVR